MKFHGGGANCCRSNCAASFLGSFPGCISPEPGEFLNRVKRLLPILLGVSLFSTTALALSFKEVPELERIFNNRGVVGTFVLFDPAADTMFVWNGERAKKRFVPASTFKIANSIIGLEVGAVKDVDEVLPYGGKPQPFKQWERNMSLRDAMKASNVPIYQELARRIGLERMREGVKRLGYGNMEIGNVVDRFWLEGPLAISAIEQTQFLSRLANGDLSFNSSSLRGAKEIMPREETREYALRGKTGWLFDAKSQIGWWVGWIERDNKIYPFALNIDMMSDKDAEKRIPIGRECLKALGKL